MDELLTRLLGLLVLAMLVALAARRLSLPYTVGLVLTGVAVDLLQVKVPFVLTHSLIFLVILPPLLFEGALNIDWHKLRRDFLPILTLTVGGVLISMAVVSAGMVWLVGWPLPAALVFGVLIAATDPVAVIAMFKDNRIGGRLRLLVETESLLNDGVAAALFSLVLIWVDGSAPTFGQGAAVLLRLTGGGLGVGVLSATLAMVVAGRSADHLVETTLTVVVAYGAFLLAEDLHMSGVLAAVAGGLLIGNLRGGGGRLGKWLSIQGNAFLVDFWEFAAFIANSVIFILIGLSASRLPLTANAGRVTAVAIVLTLAGRALSVYPLCLLFSRSRWAIPRSEQHVLWWGGLRGALGLALALSLPQSLPAHDEVVFATFGVVTFSVVIQGLTMPRLLRLLGLMPKGAGGGRGHVNN